MYVGSVTALSTWTVAISPARLEPSGSFRLLTRQFRIQQIVARWLNCDGRSQTENQTTERVCLKTLYVSKVFVLVPSQSALLEGQERQVRDRVWPATSCIHFLNCLLQKPRQPDINGVIRFPGQANVDQCFHAVVCSEPFIFLQTMPGW
jgi:hypothetical protein